MKIHGKKLVKTAKNRGKKVDNCFQIDIGIQIFHVFRNLTGIYHWNSKIEVRIVFQEPFQSGIKIEGGIVF